MKKILTFAMAMALVFGLVACGNKDNNTDGGTLNGTYTAQMDADWSTENNRGYQDQLTVKYEDGVIVEASYDSIRIEDGMKKSEADYDAYGMDGPDGEPYPPIVWIPEINANIVAGGNSGSIDAVAGATGSYENAQILLKAIEDRGEEGKTITVNPDED